jgi:hypothetical protein
MGVKVTGTLSESELQEAVRDYLVRKYNVDAHCRSTAFDLQFKVEAIPDGKFRVTGEFSGGLLERKGDVNGG